MNWDFQSVFFVLVLAFLSGLAAFLGDRIGTHIGKRRISVFGMRPRHTAAVLAALFGFVVTLVGVAALFILSDNVRYFIERGSQAKAQFSQVQSELDGARSGLAEARSELEERSKELQTTTQQLAEAEKRRAELQTAQGQLQASARLLRTDAQRLRQEASALRQSAAQARSGLTRTQGQLASANKSLADTRSSIGALETQLKTLQTQRDQLTSNNTQFQSENEAIQRRNLELTNDLARRQEEVDALNLSIEGLQSAIKDLEGARSLQETALKGAQADLTVAQREADVARRELESVRSDLDTANLRLEAAQIRLLQSEAPRVLPLILNLGDELARVSVPARLNAAEARQILLAGLDRAEDFALSRGAQPPRGQAAAVSFVDIPAQGRTIPAAEQISRTVQGLSGGQDDLVFIISALVNIFRGEGVPIVVRIQPNPIVYRDGEVIAETRIDGRLNDSEIADAVSAFVSRELKAAAIERGMIPSAGRDVSLGALSQPVLLRLVEELRTQARQARVQFVSKNAARAADRLELEFVIK